MPLSLTSRKNGPATVIDLKGKIIFGAECDVLRSEVKALLDLGPQVILNLEHVDYVDSGGVGTLVGLLTSAKAAGGDLKLAAANDKVQHVLEITKLVTILGTYPTEDKAVSAIAR
jgi:anti-sigma B factor antagonist